MDPAEPYLHPAGVCYACSVQCHGEHTLVEIFNKRNFTCDCGTTRFSLTGAPPCSLRINPATNTKGGVRGELHDADNKYNHNFRNRFCGCALEYDPFQQKGTMFQCLGLGTHETGGCGEDWWHPGCVVGLGPKWFEHDDKETESERKESNAEVVVNSDSLPTISEDVEEEIAAPAPHQADSFAGTTEGGGGDYAENDDDREEPPMPPGFPKEEDFEGFICYKCVDAYPWIRQYAGAPGFLPAVLHKKEKSTATAAAESNQPPRKRKAEDSSDDANATDVATKSESEQDAKRARPDVRPAQAQAVHATGADALTSTIAQCKHKALPPPPAGQFSLFFTSSFRDNLCRCADCFSLLATHPQLLEEEETYEPPVSEDGSDGAASGGDRGGSAGGHSHGSGSLYERGESALRNVDRVRAIEGVMAYNHLKDKLKPFFQQFAESGQAISAEDIKAYFAKLRGDEQAIREAGEAAKTADHRQEQSGY